MGLAKMTFRGCLVTRPSPVSWARKSSIRRSISCSVRSTGVGAARSDAGPVSVALSLFPNKDLSLFTTTGLQPSGVMELMRITNMILPNGIMK